MRIPYPVQRGVMRLAVRWFYRRVETVGLERIPATGPVIVAANHTNALVDALVVASQVPREVRLTAKATLLENPLTRVVVHAVGIVPLRRATDEAKRGRGADAARNEGAFDAIVRTLAAGGLVLVFPEGISHSEPALAPLRTGCARMALQALDTGIMDTAIIPVGLTFEAKGRPRSRVLMTVGTPIPASAVRGDSDRVQALTTRVADGLRDVTLNFPSRDAAAQVLSVARTLARALGTTRPVAAAEAPLRATVHLARRVEDVRRALPQLPPQEAAEVAAFATRLDAWQQRATALGVGAGEVDMPTTVSSGLFFVAREAVLALVAAPVALWGRVNHLLPLRLAVRIGRATARNPDEPAMHTLVGGFVLVLLVYAVLAALVARGAGWGWAAIYLASLPAAASVDLALADRWRAVLRRARGYVALRRHPQEARALLEEREALRAMARDLEARVGASPRT